MKWFVAVLILPFLIGFLIDIDRCIAPTTSTPVTDGWASDNRARPVLVAEGYELTGPPGIYWCERGHGCHVVPYAHDCVSRTVAELCD
jgi:hypothetical protein